MNRPRLQTLAPGTIKRLHVNRHVIADNRKNGKRGPALTIQTSRGPFRAHAVNILGPSTMIYSPDKPLSCGASAWIETCAAVEFTTDPHDRVEPKP